MSVTNVDSAVLDRICNQRDYLLRCAMSLCGDAVQAEELVQEALTRACEKVSELRNHDLLEHWTKKILINLHRDKARVAGREFALGFEPASRLDSPLRLLERDEFLQQLRSAMGHLNPQMQQVLGLVGISGLSYESAAILLDVPVGTVMSRLSRARHALRPLLDQYDLHERDADQSASWEGSLPTSCPGYGLI